MNQFKRKIVQRFAFAFYMLIILYCIYDIYNVVFKYDLFIERLVEFKFNKLYFASIFILIILNVIDAILDLTTKENTKSI